MRNVVFIFAFQTKTAGDRIKTAEKEMKIEMPGILVLPFVLCLASCVSLEKNIPVKVIQPETAAYERLDSIVADVLFSPDHVDCYTLVGKEDVDTLDFQIEPHWVRDGHVGELAPQMVGVLQFTLLTNGENYQLDSIRPKAPYIPILEFEFQQKTECVHVLVSTSDLSWTIVYGDKSSWHFNYHDHYTVGRFCDYLLQDSIINKED